MGMTLGKVLYKIKHDECNFVILQNLPFNTRLRDKGAINIMLWMSMCLLCERIHH